MQQDKNSVFTLNALFWKGKRNIQSTKVAFFDIPQLLLGGEEVLSAAFSLIVEIVSLIHCVVFFLTPKFSFLIEGTGLRSKGAVGMLFFTITKISSEIRLPKNPLH